MNELPYNYFLSNLDVFSETGAEPSLQATQMKLKRARLADNLNEKIAQRPGPMELVEKNILPVDSNLKQAIIGGNLWWCGAAFGREDVLLGAEGLFSAVVPQWVRSTILRCWMKTAAMPSLQSSQRARSLRAPFPLQGSTKCWRCPLQGRPPQHYRAACCRCEYRSQVFKGKLLWIFSNGRLVLLEQQIKSDANYCYASFVWFRSFQLLHTPQQWSLPMTTLCFSHLSLLSPQHLQNQAQLWWK